jgi:hypothetical protein
MQFFFLLQSRLLAILVATTAGNSAAGVELPTDVCRQPAGTTDENSFFYFFMAGDHFWGGEKISLKKWRFLHKKWSFSPSTARLHYLLRLHRLHPVRPCTV